MCWLYRYRDGMEVPQEFEIIPFSGGFYAVATDIDQQTDTAAMNREVNALFGGKPDGNEIPAAPRWAMSSLRPPPRP